MKRIFALLLCAALLLTVFPVSALAAKTEPKEDEIYVYTEADNALLDNDVFASIETVKLEAAEACGGIGKMTEQDYLNLVPQVIRKVEASATYVPGTLENREGFLFWQTTVGIPCCYDPRMEAKLNNTENDPTPEEIALAEARAEAIRQDVGELCGGGPYTADIGLIQPYWESSSHYADSSFNSYSPQYKAMMESLAATTGGSTMRYAMETATVDNIGATMAQCGLVMFDSHGTTDGGSPASSNSSYLCLTTATGITSQDTQVVSGPHGSYSHCIRSGSAAYVDGTCIGYHMPNDAPNSYLYMGICLGMATNGMESGLRAKGVEVVYGYSQSVTFAGDMDYMNYLNTAVKNGDDIGTAVANMKAAVGCPDPYTSSSPAWPIVSSSEDPYPGQGNVDRAQTVYSTWSLFGTNYEVTGVSNNESWGTVTVLGSNITAHPAEGYYAAGYQILSGTATVTQSGNVFRVQAESDCTVQINFAAKTPALVNYFANGTAVGSENSYLGDDVILPTEAPEIYGYRFRGWVDAPVYETNVKPAYYKPGASYTVLSVNVNIYALYSCVIGGGGIAYKLVDEEPDEWEGNYVISGSKTGTIYVLKALASGGNYENNSGGSVVTHTEAGMDLDEDLLREVAEDYIWQVEASGSGYTIRNLGNETYLGSSGLSLYSLGANGNGAVWTFSYVPNVGTRANNLANTSYPYLVFYNNTKFALYGESTFNQYPVQFWKETEDGETFYYTELTPHEHELVHVEAAEPTCTENGNLEHWRCTLCGKCFTDAAGENEIPAASVVLTALGHTPGEAVTENETAPNCGVAGGYDSVTYCTVCSAEVSRTHVVIPPTGDHSYGDWSSNSNGTHSRFCSVCGGEDSEACSYEDEVIPPTPADQGCTVHTCTVCGYSYYDSFVPALGFDYTVHFAVPEGVEQPADMISNTNTGILLPVVAAPEGYAFLGWVADVYDNVTDKPAGILTGRYTASEEITLNALFVHYEGGEATYVLLSAAPADWSGNYVISYGADAAYVMKGIEADKSYEDRKNGGAALLADTGMVLNGDTLSNVAPDYVFTAEAHGSAYGFRSLSLGSYLADRKLSQSYTLRSAGAYADDCAWKLSVASNGVVTLKSQVADANRAFLSFFKTATGSSYYFRAYASVDQIRLWKEFNTGTPYYTTVLGEPAHEHTPGEAVEENAVPATCTEAGGYDLVVYCSVCGEELSREHVTVEALGHDYAAVVTEPSCTEAGFTTYTCTRCGDSYTADETEALGHAWDEGVVTVEPTETEPGVKTFTCARCGETKTEEIPVLEHNCQISQFADVMETYPDPESPEHQAIEWAFTHDPKITEGMNAATFGVGGTLTRAQAATFLYAAAGKPDFDATTAENPFKDVKADKWYTVPVLWAYSEGLFNGYADGSFKLNETLSRGQIMVILYAWAGKPDIEGLENPYTDVPAGKWFTDSAIWAYNEGIECGADGKYVQSTPCTREAMVLYLYRFLEHKCLANN